ncbi:hypothetical protein V8C37DRAFT_411104 [Trichoderma ceciliae]
MKLHLGLEDAHQGPCLPQDHFIGTMVLSYPTQVNAASPGKFTTVTEYRDLKWDEDPSGESIYTTPIEFQFPKGACYCDRPKKCQLPPSMNINEHDMSIRVAYAIIVSVGRCVLGPMTKTKGVALEVPFSCNPILTTLPRSCCVLSIKEHDDGTCPSYNPKYSPSIKLQPTPVQVILHTPTDMIESGNVYLRSVSMDLKSSVTTSFGMLARTATQTNHGCSMAGAGKIDNELFQLDSGAWGSFFVMNTKPTTESCILRMDHAMEIVTGISLGVGNDIKYATATMDPPPAYEVGDMMHV